MAAGILARQTELARSEERLRATLENTPSITMQWYDLRGRIVYWNRASEIMYGCSSEQALGVCIAENPLMFADQEHATGFIKVLAEIDRTGQPFGPAEFKLRGKEGEMLTVLATSFAIPAEDGGKIFVCMGVDITAQRTVEDEIRALNSELERRVGARTGELVQANRELASTVESLKSTQEQLVQADKLAALGSMVAGIAHELNTPIGNSVLLTSTLGDKTADFARLVEADKLRRADLKQYLETAREALILMDRNLASAVNLIRSFKQVSADRASSQRRRFDLAPVCHDVVATLMPAIRRAGHRIEVEVNDGIEMESYPGPLGQIITNFVNNAMLHAFGQGQHGLMRLQCSHIGTDGVEIRFSDNGCGIPLADHRRIFDPFFTTKLGTGGSGLGLNIVYNIVTGLLGGTISFDSEVDEGTTFIIVLPLVTSAH